uniref:Uncharacterized protein n=1 Tax=Aegilops tauschii TaxID=37682 RepID=M8B8Z7_AEGTA
MAGFASSRPASLALCGFLIFLNVFAFLLAVGAEQRRSTVRPPDHPSSVRAPHRLMAPSFSQGKVVPDEYDERSYCLYDTDASTVYGVCAFFVLLLAQLLVTGVTRCLCFGPALSSRGCAVAAFAVSWCASLNPRFGSIRALFLGCTEICFSYFRTTMTWEYRIVFLVLSAENFRMHHDNTPTESEIARRLYRSAYQALSITERISLKYYHTACTRYRRCILENLLFFLLNLPGPWSLKDLGPRHTNCDVLNWIQVPKEADVPRRGGLPCRRIREERVPHQVPRLLHEARPGQLCRAPQGSTLPAALVCYWSYSKAADGGFIKHQNEAGVGMTDYGLDRGGGPGL